MKKVAVIPAVVLAALCTFTGCKKEEVENVIAPLVSDGQTTESTEEAQEEKDPLIPEIDTSVEIQAGSRVAVVSKSTSGEFWGLVKKGAGNCRCKRGIWLQERRSGDHDL